MNLSSTNSDVIYQEKIVYRDRIKEVPLKQIEYVEKIIEVPVLSEKIVYVDKIKEIEKEIIIYIDKIVEVPRERIIYKQVEMKEKLEILLEEFNKVNSTIYLY